MKMGNAHNIYQKYRIGFISASSTRSGKNIQARFRVYAPGSPVYHVGNRAWTISLAEVMKYAGEVKTQPRNVTMAVLQSVLAPLRGYADPADSELEVVRAVKQMHDIVSGRAVEMAKNRTVAIAEHNLSKYAQAAAKVGISVGRIQQIVAEAIVGSVHDV